MDKEKINKAKSEKVNKEARNSEAIEIKNGSKEIVSEKVANKVNSLKKESLLKQYNGIIVALLALVGLYFYNEVIAKLAFENSLFQFKSMLLIIPPVFILLGLLDVWVERETMIKYLGEDSGLKGIAIAFFMGSCAAGPLYGAFPMVAVLLKKGAKFSNVLIFLGAWSTTKIPMFIFETSALGYKFSFLRLFLDVIGIYVIAQYMERSTSKEELKEIYTKAQNLF